MHQNFLNSLRRTLNTVRQHAQQKGAAIINASVVDHGAKPTDIVVNIDEQKLSSEIEEFETILGELDGVLSLKNATVMIQA